jgi:hypothetical protein
MGRWLFGTIVSSALLTIGWVFFTRMLPRRVAGRVARPPQQPLTVLPGDERQVSLPIDAETQLSAAKMAHDRFLEEAGELIRAARGAGLFTENLLTEAAEKAGDAVKLRPGSFDANLMCGEIAVKRALMAAPDTAVDLLQRAAGFFATASETKRGVVDTYVGRGWAHLERAYRLEGEDAAAAYGAAAEAFGEGFGVNSHNLFVLRGWGLAVDGLARTLGERAEPTTTAEERYQMALAEHRAGDHELYGWYAGVRASAEPVRIPMPPVRDRY